MRPGRLAFVLVHRDYLCNAVETGEEARNFSGEIDQHVSLFRGRLISQLAKTDDDLTHR